MMDTNI